MENNEDSILPSTSSEQEDTSQKGSVVDMMLGKSNEKVVDSETCLLYTSPSPRDATLSRMPSSA